MQLNTHFLVVVVTNQINFSSRRTANPCGGNIMAHVNDYRVSLKRIHDNLNKIVAKITATTYHPENEACIIINV